MYLNKSNKSFKCKKKKNTGRLNNNFVETNIYLSYKQLYILSDENINFNLFKFNFLSFLII